MDKRDTWVELGRLVRSARDEAGLSQPQLAALLSDYLGEKYAQSLVSDNERGDGWGGRDGRLPAAYAAVLNIPSHDIQRALGLPDLGDAVEPRTFADYVRADPTLDDTSKQHLISQYGLLRAATTYNRSRPTPLRADRPTRDEIEGMDLPRHMKDLLLAELAATEPDDEEPLMSRVSNI